MKEVICVFLSLFTPNQKTRPGSTLSEEESFMRAEIYKQGSSVLNTRAGNNEIFLTPWICLGIRNSALPRTKPWTLY